MWQDGEGLVDGLMKACAKGAQVKKSSYSRGCESFHITLAAGVCDDAANAWMCV